MDVLALPTYREGFPTVALEAQAAAKPVVATRSTGVVDAVVDGITGILVPIGDIQALSRALTLVMRDRDWQRHSAWPAGSVFCANSDGKPSGRAF